MYLFARFSMMFRRNEDILIGLYHIGFRPPFYSRGLKKLQLVHKPSNSILFPLFSIRLFMPCELLNLDETESGNFDPSPSCFLKNLLLSLTLTLPLYKFHKFFLIAVNYGLINSDLNYIIQFLIYNK